MRGDETRTNEIGAEDLPERRGPRHAAPRKSLLTKLHMPAGKKAFALAAMPTAVFVGMGLTPKLAMADDSTDIPFAPGPCVTRSDEPSESQEPEPTPSATASEDADKDKGKDGTGKDDAGSDEETAAPEPSASPSASAQDSTAEATEQKADAAPTPTPTKSTNPLDPLGVGDALKDLFDGKDEATAEPSASATEGTPEPSTSASATEPAKEAADEAKDTADEAKDTVDETTDAIRDAAEKAGEDVEELDEDVKGLDPVKDEDIPDGAKERFPCPTADPEALAAADLEQGIPLLPDAPWTLETSKLTLTGLDYKGIVEVKTVNGTVKKALKFTADTVDIKDLHQLTEGPTAGTTGHVKAEAGSTSTIRNGTVTMYTEELKGNLFGIIPVTFSPETPPPLNVPFAFFTDATVKQAGQFGGSLKVPGLQNYFTGGGS
ncbi:MULTISPECIES: hypothetical protein [unclassified Streptomyces]|uniref:hypothetical protein n=1 Tax=unclassified Streptomyces TaxID=2593676 RepID=UPI00093CBBEA|nr:hypothetical protein [Streptomyces sp. CB02058]OKI98267.1 hypothetical protein AMK10_05595 [Streptomyces sp. CB02058]